MIDQPKATSPSLLCAVDPAWRIAMATGFTAVVALVTRPAALAAALAVSLVLVAASGLTAKETARRLAVVAGLMSLIWITLPLAVTGQALFHLGPMAFSRNGAILALAISVKTVVMTAAFLAMVATLPAHTIGHGLERLGCPAKLVHLLLLAFRYITVFEHEYQRLVRAARVRGFRPTTTVHAYRTYAYFVGMLFVRAWTRAERVDKAMRCRGFSGRFHSLQHFSGGKLNWVFAGIMTGAAVMVLSLDKGQAWTRIP